jgi:hypothetical protein
MTIPFLPFPKNGGRLPSGAASTALTPPEHPARRNAQSQHFRRSTGRTGVNITV